MSASNQYFKNHFLIALPSVSGGFFEHTLTYLCEHDEKGAMGLVINQHMGVHTSEILGEMNIEHGDDMLDEPVLAGGPVQQERGFILHRRDGREWQNSLNLNDYIALTTSPDILKAFADNSVPDGAFVCLGYAGWDAGQLEQELLDNCWLTLPADPEILFDLPVEQRYDAALAKLGVRAEQLTHFSGHA